ncbi:hypothetical protein TSMEX_001842 [Taenia solium]|eukprot:TsM_000352100 transcript=TsM_000352100 gene=TsM_000352100
MEREKGSAAYLGLLYLYKQAHAFYNPLIATADNSEKSCTGEKQDYDDEDLRCIKDAILTDWDADRDGKIYIDELKMMLRVQRQMAEK